MRNATTHNKSDAAEIALKWKCHKVASLPFTHQLSCQLQAKVYWWNDKCAQPSFVEHMFLENLLFSKTQNP